MCGARAEIRQGGLSRNKVSVGEPADGSPPTKSTPPGNRGGPDFVSFGGRLSANRCRASEEIPWFERERWRIALEVGEEFVDGCARVADASVGALAADGFKREPGDPDGAAFTAQGRLSARTGGELRGCFEVEDHGLLDVRARLRHGFPLEEAPRQFLAIGHGEPVLTAVELHGERSALRSRRTFSLAQATATPDAAQGGFGLGGVHRGEALG